MDALVNSKLPFSYPNLKDPTLISCFKDQLAVASTENIFYLKNKTWRKIVGMSEVVQTISSLAIHDDQIVYGTSKGVLEVIFFDKPIILRRNTEKMLPVMRLIFAQDSSIVFVLMSDNSFYRWSTNNDIFTRIQSSVLFYDLHIARNGVLLCASEDGIRLFSPPDYSNCQVWEFTQPITLITATDKSIVAASQNKIYEINFSGDVVNELDIGNERIHSLLVVDMLFFGIERSGVLILSDYDRIHFYFNGIIIVVDCSSFQFRYNQFQSQKQEENDIFDSAQSFAVIGKQILYLSSGVNKLNVFTIRDFESLADHYLNTKKADNVFQLIGKSQVFVDQHQRSMLFFKKALRQCQNDWIVHFNFMKPCFSSSDAFYEFMLADEKRKVFENDLFSFIYEKNNYHAISTEIVTKVVEFFSKDAEMFKKILLNTRLDQLDLNYVTHVSNRLQIPTCLFYTGHYIELKSFIELLTIFNKAYQREQFDEIFTIFKILGESCWCGIQKIFGHQCNVLSDKLAALNWLIGEDIPKIMNFANHSNEVLSFFLMEPTSEDVVNLMVKHFKFFPQNLTSDFVFEIWNLFKTKELKKDFFRFFQILVANQHVDYSSDFFLMTLKSFSNEQLENIVKVAHPNNRYIVTLIYFLLENIEDGVKSMKEWHNQTENSHNLFWMCLTILYETSYNPSTSRDLLLDYFDRYPEKAVEFTINLLNVVITWSLEFPLIQQVYRHALFFVNFSNFDVEEKSQFVIQLITACIDKFIDQGNEIVDEIMCQCFMEFPIFVTILLDIKKESFSHTNVGSFPLLNLFINLHEANEEFNLLKDVLMDKPTKIIQLVHQIFDDLPWLNSKWMVIILDVLVNKIKYSNNNEEQKNSSKLAIQILGQTIERGTFNQNYEVFCNLLEPIIPMIIPESVKFFQSLKIVQIQNNQLLNLQKREGMEIIFKLKKHSSKIIHVL